MNLLDEAREIINETDKEMAKLFQRRMEAVKKVAQYKIEHALPVLDTSREKQVIDRNCGYVEDDFIRQYYVNFLKNTMALSRDMQASLISGMKAAYSGVKGAFAHIAAKKIFPTANLMSYPDFKTAYSAVESGECDCVILPIENSFAGEVGTNMDLIFSGTLYINGIYELKIKQNLLGIKGAKIDDIKNVVSHSQALEQCREYIEKHDFLPVPAKNTAVAAQEVAGKGDIHTAAIASLETAKLYGLCVLEDGINESELNTTRFAVLSRAKNNAVKGDQNNFMLVFSVRNQAGALAKAMDIIGKHGFSMQMIRSRSMQGLLWQYYFYCEVEGDINTENGANMLSELGMYCDKLRVVGAYGPHIKLED